MYSLFWRIMVRTQTTSLRIYIIFILVDELQMNRENLLSHTVSKRDTLFEMQAWMWVYHSS